MLIKEDDTKDNAADRKKIGDERCASWTDFVEEVIKHDHGEARAEDTKPESRDPRNGK
jgi:hypothetical protein